MKRIIIIIGCVFGSMVILVAQDASKGLILKVKPLSPLMSSIAGGAEVAVSENNSIELKVGFLGVSRGSIGYYATIGPRQYFHKSDWNVSSIFQSAYYIQPEMAYSTWFTNDFTNSLSGESSRYIDSSIAFIMNLGYKKAIGNRWSLDMSAGLGSGARQNSSGSGEYYQRSYYHSHTFISTGRQVLFSMNMSVGYILGSKTKNKSKSKSIRQLDVKLSERADRNYYVGILGDYSLLSVNVEKLFKIKQNSFWAARAGLGFIPAIDLFVWGTDGTVSASSHATYNLGKHIHFLEVGPAVNIAFSDNSTVSALIGYRRQVLQKKQFVFRTYIQIPVIGDDIIPIGFSLGRTF